MKMFTCQFAQDEVTHHRLRAGSKKSDVGSRPARRETRHSRGKVAAILTRGASATCVSTENGDLLREAAPAKAGNAVGGFFQQTLKRKILPTGLYDQTGLPLGAVGYLL